MDPLGYSDGSPPKIVPVKVRRKHLTETERLEIENRKMEERLQALRDMLSREKEAREKMGGSIWRSGKQGPIASHATQVLEKGKEKREKRRDVQYKTLPDSAVHLEPLRDPPMPKPAPPPIPREPPVPRVATGAMDARSGDDASPVKVRTCGQCEVGTATVTCIECREFFCDECFVDIHRKGALRSHTVKRLQDEHLPRYDRRRFRPSSRPQSAGVQSDEVEDAEMVSEGMQATGSLLEGTFDERESHQSFLDALNEWRGVSKKANVQKTSSAVTTSAVDSPRASMEKKPAQRMWSAEQSQAGGVATGTSAGTGASLLNGDFNEDESHRYFLDALEAWRNKHGHGEGAPAAKEPPAPSNASSGIQTESRGSARARVSQDVAIPDSQQSLSYMERLLVKQYRRDPHVIERIFRTIVGDGETPAAAPSEDAQEDNVERPQSAMEERANDSAKHARPPSSSAVHVEAAAAAHVAVAAAVHDEKRRLSSPARDIEATEVVGDAGNDAPSEEPIVSEPASPRAAPAPYADGPFQFDATVEELTKAATAIQRQFRRRKSEIEVQAVNAAQSETARASTPKHEPATHVEPKHDESPAPAAEAPSQPDDAPYMPSASEATAEEHRAASVIQAKFRRMRSIGDITATASKDKLEDPPRPGTAPSGPAPTAEERDAATPDFDAPAEVQHRAASVIQAQFRKRQASLRDLRAAESAASAESAPAASEAPATHVPTEPAAAHVTSEQPAVVAPAEPAQEVFDFGTPIEDQEKAARLIQANFRFRKGGKKATEEPAKAPVPAPAPVEKEEAREVPKEEKPVPAAVPEHVVPASAPPGVSSAFEFDAPLDVQNKAASVIQAQFRRRRSTLDTTIGTATLSQPEPAPGAPAAEPTATFEFEAPIDVQHKAASVIQAQFRRKKSLQNLRADSEASASSVAPMEDAVAESSAVDMTIDSIAHDDDDGAGAGGPLEDDVVADGDASVEAQIELDADMMDPSDGKASRRSAHGLDENELMQDFEEMERRVESGADVHDDTAAGDEQADD